MWIRKFLKQVEKNDHQRPWPVVPEASPRRRQLPQQGVTNMRTDRRLAAVLFGLGAVALTTADALGMYNPTNGRFLQRDPAVLRYGTQREQAGYVDGLNRYEYAGSNPANRQDITGRQWQRPVWSVRLTSLKEPFPDKVAGYTIDVDFVGRRTNQAKRKLSGCQVCILNSVGMNSEGEYPPFKTKIILDDVWFWRSQGNVARAPAELEGGEIVPVGDHHYNEPEGRWCTYYHERTCTRGLCVVDGWPPHLVGFQNRTSSELTSYSDAQLIINELMVELKETYHTFYEYVNCENCGTSCKGVKPKAFGELLSFDGLGVFPEGADWQRWWQENSGE